MPFPESKEGQTHFCPACETDARSGVKSSVHVCGVKSRPNHSPDCKSDDHEACGTMSFAAEPLKFKCIHDRQMKVIRLLCWVTMVAMVLNIYSLYKLDVARVCQSAILETFNQN